jgi:hypothetical protein
MNTMIDPKRITGNFMIVDPKLKARYGKRPFVFGERQWTNICDWIKDELVMNAPSFDMDLLVSRMMHKDVEVRRKNQRIWMGYVLSAARRDTLIVINRNGEFQISNAPKLRARVYKHGISLCELTKIIVEHRDRLVEWKKDNTSKPVEAPTEEQVEAPTEEPVEAPADVEIVLENVDDWEDICV